MDKAKIIPIVLLVIIIILGIIAYKFNADKQSLSVSLNCDIV